MSATALTALALEIGVPLLGRILTRRLGNGNAQLITDVIGAIANRLGVSTAQAETMVETDRPRVIEAMREVEQQAPELIALHAAALEGQFALLQAEQKGPWWGWAWRPAFMWLLGLLWLWNAIVLHVCNAIWRLALPPMDATVLLSLTSVYAAFYMGGHTIKDWARQRGGDR